MHAMSISGAVTAPKPAGGARVSGRFPVPSARMSHGCPHPAFRNGFPARETEPRSKAALSAVQNQLEFPAADGEELAAVEAVLEEGEVEDPQAVLEDMAKFIITDLKRFVDTGALTKARYSPDLIFTDPVTYIEGFTGFKLLMDSMRFLFKVGFDAHSAEVTGPQDITTKWTMYLKQEQLPWQPSIILSGKTFYTIDLKKKQVLKHVDEWDIASHNKFFSLDAMMEMSAQLMKFNNTPDLETPNFSVLRKTKSYEVRKYSPFIVAETEMDAGSGPAGGSGFGELAKFIFGGNEKQLAMDMTTPVISTAAQGRDGGNRMQFVMSSRFGSPEDLPAASSDKITCKAEDPGVVAAIEFPGWPVDFEVVQAEKKLRTMLLQEGLKPLPGYQLARYNDPGTLPMMRRNEVLIKLESIEL